jgi:hypothetical protein
MLIARAVPRRQRRMTRELPRFSLERTFFWHGILMFNENGGHSLFPF